MKDKKLFGKILIILLLYLAHITIHSLYHCFSKYTLIPVVFSAAYIMQPYPGTPDVTQVEIPFTVTYEINGKQVICEDTIICTYEGWEVILDVEKVSVWSEKLKSGNDYIVIAEFDDIKVCASYGCASDYIVKNKEDFEGINSELIVYNSTSGHWKVISQEEAYESYGIKSISCKAEPVVVNYSNSLKDMLLTKIK